jgi:hypothetical protein
MATVHTLRVRDNGADVPSLQYYSQTWDILAFTGEDEDTACAIVASFRTLDDANAYVQRATTDPQRTAWGHVARPPSTMLAAGLAWFRFTLEARYADGVNVTQYRATI